MDKEGHLTKEERATYWARTLAPSALLAASDHLQTCGWCREQLLQGRPPIAPENEPGYDELVSWLENTLDPIERQEMAQRLAANPPAAAELAELTSFREEMNQFPPHDYAFEAGESNPRSGNWLLAIAAGLAVGLVLLWWNASQRSESRGVALRDAGKEIVVRADGAVPALGRLPADLQEALQANSLGKIRLPAAVAALQSGAGALAGAPVAEKVFTVFAPVGTLVETTRPALRWSELPGATGYRVNVAPQSGGEVVSSAILAASERTWTPHEELKPGETYDWDVEALRSGEMVSKAPAPPAPEARFAILPNDKRKELAARRAQFGRSHLLMGLTYAQAGLLPQAQAEFEMLARENPKSELPRQLLRSLTKSGQ